MSWAVHEFTGPRLEQSTTCPVHKPSSRRVLTFPSCELSVVTVPEFTLLVGFGHFLRTKTGHGFGFSYLMNG